MEGMVPASWKPGGGVDLPSNTGHARDASDGTAALHAVRMEGASYAFEFWKQPQSVMQRHELPQQLQLPLVFVPPQMASASACAKCGVL